MQPIAGVMKCQRCCRISPPTGFCLVAYARLDSLAVVWSLPAAMTMDFPEAFFLYAETVRPTFAEATSSLEFGYRLCASGTHRYTPDVATYLFRIDPRLSRIYRNAWPGCCATESVELYLTLDSFHDHAETEDFRKGLRHLYQGVGREHIRIFWIGPRPPDDALAKIFRSDVRARPLAPIRLTTFDRQVARRSRPGEAALLSVGLDVEPELALDGIHAVDRFANELEHISFAAFFHPDRRDELRLLVTLPEVHGQLTQLLQCAAALDRVSKRGVEGHLAMASSAAGSILSIRSAMTTASLNLSVGNEGVEGYVLHPEQTDGDEA